MSEDKKFIRLVKNVGNHWPFFTHPELPDCELNLTGAFHVKWPDGSVTVEEVQSKQVHVGEISGVFQYFEHSRHGLDIVHELHEVELLDEEVARCVINPSKAACAG